MRRRPIMAEPIRLDARGWTDAESFYDAFLAAVDAPSWHGHSLDALSDSLIGGGINGIEPPFAIEILCPARPVPALTALFDALVEVVDDARALNRPIELSFVYI
jgi:RNAse (barnase) inhibitor barstar